MKKLIALLIVVFVCTCQIEVPHPAKVLGFNDIGKKEAVTIAQAEIDRGGWPEGTTITKALPIYIEGIDGISYWECQARANSKGAGYVLVNANRTDLVIPEASSDDKSLHEVYAAELGTKAFKVVRYDWFRSAAI